MKTFVIKLELMMMQYRPAIKMAWSKAARICWSGLITGNILTNALTWCQLQRFSHSLGRSWPW